MVTQLSRRQEWFLVALILLLAGALRMGWPGLTEFKADEARLLSLALEMIEERRLALRGISSSVGFPNFPASVWLYALPLMIWPHLYAATLFTGFLNTLAVAGGYLLARRYWGIEVALAATLMLAVSPWAVIFSRKIWAQNLLPLLVLGWGTGALLALVEKRSKFIVLHLVCLALAVQIHLAAVALVPATAVLFLIFWRRLAWRVVALGSGLALATALPFLLYLARQQEHLSIGGTITREQTGRLSLDSFRYTLQLSLGYEIHSLAGAAAFRDYLATVPNSVVAQLLWAALIAGGTLYLARQVWQNRRRPQTEAGLIALVWLFAPPIFFLWHSTPIYLHYFIATLPAQYIVAGVGLTAGARWLASVLPAWKPYWAASLFLGATSVIQIWLVLGILFFVSRHATPGGFGTPVNQQMVAVAAVEQLMAQTGAAELLLVGPGDQPGLHEFPAVYGSLLRHVPHRFVDVRQDAVFPAQTAVVLLDGRYEGGVESLYELVAAQKYSIPLRPGEGSLSVMTIPGSAAPAPTVPFNEIYLLNNWVNLLGYSGPEPVDANNVWWRIYWHPADQPDWRRYHFFNHLLDSNGQRLAQADGPAFRPDMWQPGDTVVSQFMLPWPETHARPFTIRVGMYHYPEIEPVLLLDIAGNPYTDAVEVTGLR
jgi:4-amino-4-deoxy-L-arabinose transferase-like glycosyltransferase